MVLDVIILIPLVFGAFMLVGAATFGEDHHSLRIFLFLLSVVMVFISLNFGMIALIEEYDYTYMEEFLAWTTNIIAIIFWFLLLYFIAYMIYKGVQMMGQKKKERLEY